MNSNVIFSNDVPSRLLQAINDLKPGRVFILADNNTAAIARQLGIPSASLITISDGDEHKNLDSLTHIWSELQAGGATRHSLLVCVGGGMVTDIGGFAAATFKRGIPFINVPTSLLGAVDAAVGGKTGFNFHNLKNEIGAFAPAHTVIISSCFLTSLPHTEFLSGFAEMIKHALLSGEPQLSELLNANLASFDPEHMLQLIRASVMVKQQIVSQDPTETGLRKALNLGHTVGHAFESFALSRGKPVPHGYAVAWGLVTELVLSHMRFGFPTTILHQVADFISHNYGPFLITCDDYDSLLQLMTHDKKSLYGEINCTLLSQCGQPRTDVTLSPDEVSAALDIYRDLLHI